jgi:hypothetical protein
MFCPVLCCAARLVLHIKWKVQQDLQYNVTVTYFQLTSPNHRPIRHSKCKHSSVLNEEIVFIWQQTVLHPTNLFSCFSVKPRHKGFVSRSGTISFVWSGRVAQRSVTSLQSMIPCSNPLCISSHLRPCRHNTNGETRKSAGTSPLLSQDSRFYTGGFRNTPLVIF